MSTGHSTAAPRWAEMQAVAQVGSVLAATAPAGRALSAAISACVSMSAPRLVLMITIPGRTSASVAGNGEVAGRRRQWAVQADDLRFTQQPIDRRVADAQRFQHGIDDWVARQHLTAEAGAQRSGDKRADLPGADDAPRRGRGDCGQRARRARSCSRALAPMREGSCDRARAAGRW